jgi:hypothetical protein
VRIQYCSDGQWYWKKLIIQTRLVDGSVDALRNTLEWAGLDYDEGVGAGGSYGPYTQVCSLL